MSEIATEHPKKKSPRPDGSNQERYKNCEKWSYRRWAWEFLRRNKRFIEACERVKDGSEEQKATVAKEFGLKRFKSCNEAYGGRSGRPAFDDGGIISWSNLGQHKEMSRRIKIRRDFGQVVIRFNLLPAIDNDSALDTQLDKAKQRLDERLNALRAKLHKPAPKQPKPQSDLFGRYIRLLDLRAYKNTYVECAKVIFPEFAYLTNSELSNLVKNSIKTANGYAAKGYRHLALRKGKPEPVHASRIYLDSFRQPRSQAADARGDRIHSQINSMSG